VAVNAHVFAKPVRNNWGPGRWGYHPFAVARLWQTTERPP